MSNKAHLWVEHTVVPGDQILVTAVLENPGRSTQKLWYRIPSLHRHEIATSCDALVIGFLFSLMRNGVDLRVHGEVSPSLLRNLDEFESVWAVWHPERYRRIEITAESERETRGAIPQDSAILAFSGGVDSSFSAWRHGKNLCGRWGRRVRTGLMIHGFDIPLAESDVFDRAASKSRAMLESIGIKLVSIETNYRDLGDDWLDAHGAAVASCLMLFQKGYECGLIASSSPYQQMHLPWGSNPLTDVMLSSESFKIIHDGASFTRIEKIRAIAGWPELRKNLRVCWEGAEQDRNCGRCEKCIRTILNFRAIGSGLPECFERDVSDRQILNLQGLKPVPLYYLQEILAASQGASISGTWVAVLEECIKRNIHGEGFIRELWKSARTTVALRTRLRRLAAAIFHGRHE